MQQRETWEFVTDPQTREYYKKCVSKKLFNFKLISQYGKAKL